MDGGVILPRIDNNDGDYYWDYDTEQDRLEGLLDGGAHFDDVNRNGRRKYRRQADLPFHLIHQRVIATDARRPERNNR